MFELKYEVANDTKKSELGIEYEHTFNTNMFHKLFLYIHCKNLIYQKKLEPNERKRSQSNYFSFKTSEIIYILIYF